MKTPAPRCLLVVFTRRKQVPHNKRKTVSKHSSSTALSAARQRYPAYHRVTALSSFTLQSMCKQVLFKVAAEHCAKRPIKLLAMLSSHFFLCQKRAPHRRIPKNRLGNLNSLACVAQLPPHAAYHESRLVR